MRSVGSRSAIRAADVGVSTDNRGNVSGLLGSVVDAGWVGVGTDSAEADSVTGNWHPIPKPARAMIAAITATMFGNDLFRLFIASLLLGQRSIAKANKDAVWFERDTDASTR